MKKVFKTKPFMNKKTKQISITLPKKKLDLSKTPFPKRMRVTVEW